MNVNKTRKKAIKAIHTAELSGPVSKFKKVIVLWLKILKSMPGPRTVFSNDKVKIAAKNQSQTNIFVS